MNQASERTECAKAAMAGTASPQTSHRDEAAIAEASANNSRLSAIYVAAFAVSIFFCYLLMRAASVWVFFGTSVSDCFYRAEDRNRWLLVVSCALLAGLLLFLITRVRSARGRWMLGLATISVLVLVVFQNAAPKGTESMLQNLRAQISPKTTWNELKATIPRQAYRRHSRPSRIEFLSSISTSDEPHQTTISRRPAPGCRKHPTRNGWKSISMRGIASAAFLLFPFFPTCGAVTDHCIRGRPIVRMLMDATVSDLMSRNPC